MQLDTMYILTIIILLDPRQEIWRLRLNWLFLIITGSLYAISYTAISSSFHQFMTNPKANNLNDTAFERVRKLSDNALA